VLLTPTSRPAGLDQSTDENICKQTAGNMESSYKIAEGRLLLLSLLRLPFFFTDPLFQEHCGSGQMQNGSQKRTLQVLLKQNFLS